METSQQRDQLAYYDNQVADYEKDNGLIKRGLTRAYERKAKIILKELADIKPKRILEIGTGSGLMTFFIAKHYKEEIVGLDLSKEMLDLAKSRIADSNVSFVVGDGTKPDFPESSFDAVIGVDIIHHLDDPRAAMKEWKKLVRPGGKMVFLETNVYNPINLRNIGVEHEVRSFLNTDQNLTLWPKDAGWEIVNVSPAPSYTPAGPKLLVPLFNLIDIISPAIPVWKKLTALWLVSAQRSKS